MDSIAAGAREGLDRTAKVVSTKTQSAGGEARQTFHGKFQGEGAPRSLVGRPEVTCRMQNLPKGGKRRCDKRGNREEGSFTLFRPEKRPDAAPWEGVKAKLLPTRKTSGENSY